MTLVKRKRRATPVQKRISGGHHKKSQKYLKAYWPYLPVGLIVAGVIAADSYLPASIYTSGRANFTGARIYALLGQANVAVLTLLYIGLTGFGIWYIIRHFKRVRRVVKYGEKVLARHYAFDVVLGILIGTTYVLVS